jgi:hypothetical protein
MGMITGVDVTTVLGPRYALDPKTNTVPATSLPIRCFERLSCFAGFILRSVSGADGEALNL